MAKKIIYLDNNATTSVDERVLDAMLPYFRDAYANAGSSHVSGLTAAEAVDDAAAEVAQLIGCHIKDIIFTSGATEGINLAMKGVDNNERKHIIVAATEHKAVLDTVGWLEQQGYTITRLKVSENGLIDLKELRSVVTPNTLLVCIMMANNETGVIQPIKEIAKIIHDHGALFLCDATQAIGKIPVDVKDLKIDLMPFSAHKIYGPKGVGALYISPSVRKNISPQIHGGGHQGNLRSGTLNVPGIVGLGKACEVAQRLMTEDTARIRHLRDMLDGELLKIEGTLVNGSIENRLHTTTNICFPGIVSEKLILALQNIAVSNGAACSAVTAQPSHVLKAMGLSETDALSSIRFSLGRFTTEEDISYTISRVTEIVDRFRQNI
ncbi:MAG: cysteine desulfurase [Flavobacterium sp.]|nr:MAG: cysteine desulfurase [Flavobacterium sp.]